MVSKEKTAHSHSNNNKQTIGQYGSTVVYRQSAPPHLSPPFFHIKIIGIVNAPSLIYPPPYLLDYLLSSSHGEQLVDKRCCEGASLLQVSLNTLHWQKIVVTPTGQRLSLQQSCREHRYRMTPVSSEPSLVPSSLCENNNSAAKYSSAATCIFDGSLETGVILYQRSRHDCCKLRRLSSCWHNHNLLPVEGVQT